MSKDHENEIRPGYQQIIKALTELFNTPEHRRKFFDDMAPVLNTKEKKEKYAKNGGMDLEELEKLLEH